MLAFALLLSACAITPGPDLEDCLRTGVAPARSESTWVDPMDALITAAIDARQESFICPGPRHVTRDI